MISQMRYNYLIVGQGLAGSVLAAHLLAAGQAVKVVNDPNGSSASKVAAGLYNPIVFKRLTKTYCADEALRALAVFYPQQERLLGARFYHPRPLHKLFAEQREVDFYCKKAGEVLYKAAGEQVPNYLQVGTASPLPSFVNAENGAGIVTHAGYVDVAAYLKHWRTYLLNKGFLHEEAFDFAHLAIGEGQDGVVAYKDMEAERIIFCEGWRCVDNPYFKFVPFKLTKGELLTLSIADLTEAESGFVDIVSKGGFLLPMGNGQFRVGATYNWDDLSESISAEGLGELIRIVERLVNRPYALVKHEAGIRPTVIDRRPLLGFHKQYRQVGLFNGLGTKGVMLAPYFAEVLVNHCLHGVALPADVDVNRFYTMNAHE